MITAMVSMGGLQSKLDLLADNIANVNTAGYKRKDATFEDLLTNMKQQEDTFRQPVRLSPMGFSQGWGSRMALIQPDLSQGPLQKTDHLYDLAIEGNALFEVATDEQGTRAYTRSGAFQLTFDRDNVPVLTNADGYALIAQRLNDAGELVEGRVVVPDGYDFRVSQSGRIQAISGDGSETIELGQVKLVQPVKPSGLSPVSDNLFVIADGLNVEEVVRTVVIDEEADIALLQGFLEQSNVNLTSEMSDLMIVQRAYQMSARALSSSDTMMGLANNLRGS